MAHDLMNDQSMYYRLRDVVRDVPWHGCGVAGENDETVIDVAERRVSIPWVDARQAWVQARTGHYVAADDTQIITGCITTDSGYELRAFGPVKKGYWVLPHYRGSGQGFLHLWHDAIPAPCETLGLLGKGETMFITVQMPTIDIAGDETQMFLAGFNVCDGKTAIRCVVTPVRVVCRNTMELGLSEASQLLIVDHRSDPRPRVSSWLRDTWASLGERSAAIKEACEILANRLVTVKDVEGIFSCVYPTISMPDSDDLDVLASWEKRCKVQKARVEDCLNIFEGSPTRTHATSNTAWGAYQAVCEYEDFGRSRVTSASRFQGEGAKRKRLAWDACASLVN